LVLWIMIFYSLNCSYLVKKVAASIFIVGQQETDWEYKRE